MTLFYLCRDFDQAIHTALPERIVNECEYNSQQSNVKSTRLFSRSFCQNLRLVGIRFSNREQQNGKFCNVSNRNSQLIYDNCVRRDYAVIVFQKLNSEIVRNSN